MNKTLVALALSLLASSSFADSLVRGYVKKDGTYVAPHFQTMPDSTRANNYSTQGNYNPYTGQTGTKPQFSNPPSTPSYQLNTPNPYGNAGHRNTNSIYK